MKLPPLDGYKPPSTAKVETAAGATTTLESPQIQLRPDFARVLADSQSAGQASSAETITDKAEQSAKDLEAFLMSMIFKYAFKNHLSGGVFGDSYESGMFLDMFIDAAAKEAADSKGLGIADMVMKDIIKRSNSEKVEDGEYEPEELQRLRKDDAGDDQQNMPGMHR